MKRLFHRNGHGAAAARKMKRLLHRNIRHRATPQDEAIVSA
jgi:hypothetical protein